MEKLKKATCHPNETNFLKVTFHKKCNCYLGRIMSRSNLKTGNLSFYRNNIRHK